ncbi:MAG: DUF502 domain-containing protein [Halobacteriaceae archaeon]
MRPIAAFKNSFIAGLFIAAPFVITVLALEILSGWLLRFVDPVVASAGLRSLTGNVTLLAQILAAAGIAIFIALLGALAQWSIGRRIFGTADRAVNLIPLAGGIYSAVKGMANSMAGGGGDYDRVVLVEYPADDVYSLGFVTSRTPDVAKPFTEGPAYNVYLPGSPNPTAGRVLLVPEDRLIDVGMTVREGLGLIVTTGATGEDAAERLPNDLPREVVPEES